MDFYMIVLRIVHILCIITWAGWIFSMTFWIQPAVAAAGPAGGAFMGAVTSKTPLVKAMTWIATLAILTGLLMMDRVSSHFSAVWFSSTSGMTLFIGGMAAIVALAWGMSTVRPAAKKMGMLGAAIAASGGTPSPDQGAQMQALRSTMKKNSNVVFVLMVIAATGMAMARYMY